MYRHKHCQQNDYEQRYELAAAIVRRRRLNDYARALLIVVAP